MKELDNYNEAKNKLNSIFCHPIYSAIADHRDSWWCACEKSIDWFEHKPSDEDIDNGADYSETIKYTHISKCGKYTGIEMLECTGDSSFCIFDNSKRIEL